MSEYDFEEEQEVLYDIIGDDDDEIDILDEEHGFRVIDELEWSNDGLRNLPRKREKTNC